MHSQLPYTLLINRIPTLNHKSPYFILLHKEPDYKLHKVFGCLCFPYLWLYNRYKMEFRLTLCILLRYSPIHVGYVFLDLKSNRMYIALCLIFWNFLYCSLSMEIQASLESSSYPWSSIPILRQTLHPLIQALYPVFIFNSTILSFLPIQLHLILWVLLQIWKFSKLLFKTSLNSTSFLSTHSSSPSQSFF